LRRAPKGVNLPQGVLKLRNPQQAFSKKSRKGVGIKNGAPRFKKYPPLKNRFGIPGGLGI